MLIACYDRLKASARRELRHWPNLTLAQTTAVVHDAYFKLARDNHWASLDAFLMAGASAIREVLVEQARARNALKRGGRSRPVSLDAVAEPGDPHALADARLLDLDAALDELRAMDAGADGTSRLVRVVECRFFAGYTLDETARLVGVTRRTVDRDWTRARAWLIARLNADGPAEEVGQDAPDALPDDLL